MEMKSAVKLFIYGIVLFLVWPLVTYILSQVINPDLSYSLTLSYVVLIIVLGAIAFAFSRFLMKAHTLKESFTYGASWVVFLVALYLYITITNKTAGTFFGNGGTYLVLAGIIAGSLLGTSKRPTASVSENREKRVPGAQG